MEFWGFLVSKSLDHLSGYHFRKHDPNIKNHFMIYASKNNFLAFFLIFRVESKKNLN